MNLRKGTFEQSLLLKPDRMAFVKLMQRWDNNPLKLQLPEDLEARPIALQFLAHSLADWNDDVQHLHIYTDGSFSPDMQVASFSFAVFGWNPSAEEDKSTFSGWLADVVLTDQLDPNYTGASHHSSMEAETAGLIWSHIWLIQSGCQLPTTFHYDSKTSGHGAAGLFQIGSNNHQLKKLRQLVHLLQTVRSGTTDYEHVKAHSGCPGNEAVDCLAKRRIKQGRSKDIAPNWQPIFLQGNDILEWAWWTYRTISCHPCNPSLRGEVCGWQNKDEISKHPSVRPIEKKEAVIEGYLGLKITVATYNVMTLRDCPNDSGQRGEDWKGALLREQFGQRRLHVIGLQETRGGSSGVIETLDYIRYIGAGDQGHHGCEIWLSKQMSLGESGGKKIHFDTTTTTTILAEEPRMMFAHVRPGGVSLILCVAL